jgi:hypothetical protein
MVNEAMTLKKPGNVIHGRVSNRSGMFKVAMKPKRSGQWQGTQEGQTCWKRQGPRKSRHYIYVLGGSGHTTVRHVQGGT